jgi:hypothetical protein
MSPAWAAGIALVFLAALAVYLWPRPEARFDKIFVAMMGAFAGSLAGRLWADPGWPLHVTFVVAGAFAFCCLDWLRRAHRTS